MAEAALAHGLEYLAITDHSRRLTMAKGLDPKQLFEQLEEIDRLNETLSGLTLSHLNRGRVDVQDADFLKHRRDMIHAGVW